MQEKRESVNNHIQVLYTLEEMVFVNCSGSTCTLASQCLEKRESYKLSLNLCEWRFCDLNQLQCAN